jgi:hypothetical protein
MSARMIGAWVRPVIEDCAMRKNSASGVAAFAAALAAGVSAQEISPPTTDIAPGTDIVAPPDTTRFRAIDQDKDGRVSRAEAIALGGELGPAFNRIDLDRDGHLSPSEFGKWKPVNPEDPAAIVQPGNDGKPGTRTPSTGD